MLDNRQNYCIPALASLHDNPLRVAAYCRSVPVSEMQWAYYSTLISFCPKWTFLGCYAGQVYAEKAEHFMGGIQQMISDCRDGKIDLIITKSPNTFGRNITDCFNLITDLQKLKTPVGIYFEGNDLYMLQENMDFYLSIFSALAIQESENKGKRSGCVYSGANLLKRTRKIKAAEQKLLSNNFSKDLVHVRADYISPRPKPKIMLTYDSFTFNTACVRLFPETEYVQIFVNTEKRRLKILPCEPSDDTAIKWSVTKNNKKHPRNVRSKGLCSQVFSLMDWNVKYSYKAMAVYQEFGGQKHGNLIS